MVIHSIILASEIPWTVAHEALLSMCCISIRHNLETKQQQRFFDDAHSDQCEVTPHCSFDLHLSNNRDIEHLFLYLLIISVFFGEIFI